MGHSARSNNTFRVAASGQKSSPYWGQFQERPARMGSIVAFSPGLEYNGVAIYPARPPTI